MFPGRLPWRAPHSARSKWRTGLRHFLFAFAAAAPAFAEAIESRPLEPRTSVAGPTLFKELRPEETGVVADNPYADPKMWGERYQEFALGAFGTGVAIGDYDQDGRADVFVVSKTGQSRLFRNLGGWKFQDVTDTAGFSVKGAAARRGSAPRALDSVEAWKQGVAFADVNNDGWLDLYICRFNAPNLLYVNQRNGTFVESAASFGLDVVDACGMAAFCDYDRDGFLDVYITTNMLDAAREPKGRRGRLYRNNGNNTFSEVTAAAGVAGQGLTHAAIWWDYDHDGWPDLYVGNDFAGPDVLLRNNRNGTFTDVLDASIPHTPYSSMGADFGDVNNDGRHDFLVADMAATTHEKDHRGMATSRELSRPEAEAGGAAPQYLRNVLLLANGTPHLQEAAWLAGLAATDWTWSVRFEDLDNDGRLDLHVTNGMNREYHNGDLRERIIATESAAERLRLMKASPVLNEQNLAYRNLGDLRFEDVSAAWGLAHMGVSFGAAFGDLDGDGDLDLVYSNYEEPPTVLRNDAAGGHRVLIALRGTASNKFGVGTRVTVETDAGVQVRDLVLARGYLSTSEPLLHFGLGEHARISKLIVDWPSGRRQVFTDLPGDRRYTITEPGQEAVAPTPEDSKPPVTPLFAAPTQDSGLRISTREKNSEENVRQAFVPVTFHRRGPAAAVVNTRARGMEILVGGTSAEPPRRLSVSSGRAGAAQSLPALALPAGVPAGPLLVFDADGDNRHDVVVAATSAALASAANELRLRLFQGTPDGGFSPAPEAVFGDLRLSVGALAAVDIDRDGRLDLFVGGRNLPGKYPLSPRSALLLNRGGQFEDATDTLAPMLREAGLVTAALWTDLDDDGWADLVLATEWGPVRCFRNREGTGFEDWSERAGFLTAGTGWWSSLAMADFNGDGRPDFVAGNVGLNTPYRASAEHPASIYYGRFGGSGGPQIVEAYQEGDRLYPRRTAKVLGSKIPFVLRRFPRTDAFARATLEEILGADAIAAAQRFQATNFSSGVFLSQSDGTWRFEPLPRVAQIAPAQGIACADFDGDGHEDIVLAQNSYAPIQQAGRFSGGIGQLLVGDGQGRFRAIAPIESGVTIPGDAKAACVLDFDEDGWPDLFLTRNNSTTLALRNEGRPERRSLAFNLESAKAADVAGAQVTVEFANGRSRTGWVSLGASYFSQSATSCFVGYDEENPPRRVRVRWASGQATDQALRGDERTVWLSPDAR